ncbi:MAG: lytic murein transglycosylase [Alphaproteobacteria bacterium]|nr:lytic murein transglycosylase [Alphaproteobacteria bacterium]
MRILVLTFFAALIALRVVSPAHAEEVPFADWLRDLRKEALTKGISERTVNAALTGVEPIARVIELDRRQPEFTWTFRKYMTTMVNADRVAKGREKLAQNHALLAEVGKKYGIQPQYLVAFWGLETDFGRLAEGYFPTVAALATLAHDGRRSAFFREQLFAALKILDQGHITPERMKGSWAGAMGHFQFIPTTFAAYATDHDGDGKIDIWGNKKDAYASAANFLTRSGWKDDEIWGREVILPRGFDFNLVGMGVKKTLGEWAKLGVRRVEGGNLPDVDMSASLVAPSGAQGPAFLIYGNFRTIMVWNRSIFYGLAIGQLADRLVGKPAFSTLGPDAERGLSFEEGKEMQERLTALGFDTGGVDGVVGAKSRDAIQEFQRKAGLTPDGYPSVELLERLRKGL